MNVIFRVDSSQVIGSGHLMRCLSMAAKLKTNYNANIYFICRDLIGNISAVVEQQGYGLILLPRAEHDDKLIGYAAWLTVSKKLDSEQTKRVISKLSVEVDKLVIDSYAIDIEWESELRPFVKEIFVIDDLANRRHDCDFLLDQNLYSDYERRYDAIVPKSCKLLLGPRYALLRDEFYIANKNKRVRDGRISNILVFFGGIDATNETAKTLKALKQLAWNDVVVNVVVGASNPHRHEIKNMCCNRVNWNYYCQVNNMAELMNQADLAIGAGGSTTWERCYLGLPAIVIAVAENQVESCRYLAKCNLINYIGLAENVTVQDIFFALKNYSKESLCKYLRAVRVIYGE